MFLVNGLTRLNRTSSPMLMRRGATRWCRHPLRLIIGIGAAAGACLAGISGSPGVGSPAYAQGRVAPTFSMTWSTGPLADQGQPIAESSPGVATLDNVGPAVVVGDRSGLMYAYHLFDGSPVTGWPVNDGGVPIDSSPSVLASPSGLDSVFVGAGNAADPGHGGYEAFSASGAPLWFSAVVDPPSDSQPAAGVQASLTAATLQGVPSVVAGSLDQEQYALAASTGATLSGWPFFTSDSVFSTAAVGDLYGTGAHQIVEGGDQTAGFAVGRNYQQGGHLRILNEGGGVICDVQTDQTVDSSPAVGPFLTAGAMGVAVGTGAFFPGAVDTNTVKAFDNACHLMWSHAVDGATTSSPALADVVGNGSLQVVEGTDTGSGGSVWVLDGRTGATIWQKPVVGRVIGSVVAAALGGGGARDVLVPTTAGMEVLDGASGNQVALLSPDLGFQNSPLVTDDPNGAVGITVAGYDGSNRGEVRHYTVPGSDGAAAIGPMSWPMFHHDPQRTGVTGTAPPMAPCAVPSGAFDGYTLAASDGGAFAFGSPFCGSAGALALHAPVVGMAKAPGSPGYWLAGADGGVFAYGGAQYEGSMGAVSLAQPVVGMAATGDGRGYWLVGADGGVFAFGDAQFFGSAAGLHLAAPVVGIAPSEDGAGYWLVGADGGVFAYGDAQYFGSMAKVRLAAPVVSVVLDVATAGYWLVGADGGVFTFGAPFFGSLGAYKLAGPVVGMGAKTNGHGYWLVGADGGVFAFGAAPFDGSMAQIHLRSPVRGIAP
jgi:hypothetical protein